MRITLKINIQLDFASGSVCLSIERHSMSLTSISVGITISLIDSESEKLMDSLYFRLSEEFPCCGCACEKTGYGRSSNISSSSTQSTNNEGILVFGLGSFCAFWLLLAVFISFVVCECHSKVTRKTRSTDVYAAMIA